MFNINTIIIPKYKDFVPTGTAFERNMSQNKIAVPDLSLKKVLKPDTTMIKPDIAMEEEFEKMGFYPY